MTSIRIVLFLLLYCSCALSQQDPQFNMYQFNLMIINPAYAGAREVPAVVALRRQQWAGFNGAPETTCLSLHTPVMRRNLGIGLTLVSDKMGPRNLIGAYGNVAYILKISERMKLSFGLSGGYNRYQFDFSRIELQQGQLPAGLTQIQGSGAIDINSGIYLRSNSFFLGVSAMHLNRPGAYDYEPLAGQNKYAYRINTHYFVTIGKSFAINENLVVAPTILVRQVNDQAGFDVNLNFFLNKRLWLGGFYRVGYGPGGLIQYYISSRLRAGISYDGGLDDARRLGPSFEAMLGFDLRGAKLRAVDVRFL